MEGLMLKLKLLYFGHLMSGQMSQLLGKDPDAGKDGRQQEKGGSSGLRWLETITNSMDMNLSKLWKTVEDRGAWSAAIHGITKGRK